MSMTAKDIATGAIAHWEHLAPVLTVPQSEDDHERLVAVLDEVLDAGRGGRNIHVGGHLRNASVISSRHTRRHATRFRSAKPVDVLAFLMEQHRLKQADLPEIGAQSVVSDVLGGKRLLNLRQVSALSKRFGISADAFIE